MTHVDLLSRLWASSQPPSWTHRQWEIALGQARRTRLLARLGFHFNDRGWMSLVPARPAAYLGTGMLAAERQHREVHWELDRIEAALSGIDTPVVVLKGAAYVLAGLPAARGRLFSDVDIMVSRDRLNEAENALLAAGWAQQPHDDYDDQYYRRWSHELPPLKHVQRGTVLDLHHTITQPTSRFQVEGRRLLERAMPARSGGRLLVLAPEDMVLHSMVHLMQEGELDTGLRDLLDIRDLVTDFSCQADFWPKLLDRASELRLQIPLSHALVQLNRLFGLTWPTELDSRVARLDQRRLGGPLMARLLTAALRPHHPTCDTAWTDAARLALYVRSHYLRMPVRLVVPHLIRKAFRRLKPKTS